MPALRTKKVVAVCFLEAVALTLEHLREHRLTLTQDRERGHGEILRVYGEMRRLRDYLQRCINSNHAVVAADLTDHDASLLVAACTRAIEGLHVRLLDDDVGEPERQWSKKKMQVLADWCVELAAAPILELPLPRLTPVMCEAVRALTNRVRNKLAGKSGAAQMTILAPGAAGPAPVSGTPEFGRGGQLLAGEEASANQTASIAGAALPLTGAPSTATDATSPSWTAPSLIDRQKLQNPRLRGILGMDLATFERAERDGDYRVAVMMLGAVTESALIDHVQSRRGEYDVKGQPDTWRMQEVLMEVLAENAQPRDLAMASQLFVSRNLLRPALQVATPIVITLATLERLREFVRRALYTMGFEPSTDG